MRAMQTSSGHQHTSTENTFHHGASAAHADVHGNAADAAIRRMSAEGAQAGHEPFPVGTELWVHRPLGYHHAGIYVGNGEVVQVHAEPVDVVRAGLRHPGASFPVHIDRVPMADFAKGAEVKLGPDGTAHNPQLAVERALSKVGSTWQYNVLTHNCQHFTSWCITGHAVSQEAQAFENALHKVADLPSQAGHGIVNGVENLAHGVNNALHHLHW